MSDIVIWHNPRCSKSRQTLAKIEEAGHTPEVVLYLEAPPSAEEIGRVLGLLGVDPRDLMRKKEAAYSERGLADASLGREALIAAMAEAPTLIERPVVIRGARAVLGRPPENVDALL